MHYHAEIIMPQTDDIESAIEKYMADFSENNEETNNHFWDWYEIGGRYSGSKIKSLCDTEKLKQFYAELNAEKITVSGIQCGKQELSPASQQSKVDAIWLSYFPDSPIRVAPMFQHSGKHAPMDVCKVSEIPPKLTAYTVMICGNERPITLLHKEIWNGCTHQKADWNGNVLDAIAKNSEKMNIYSEKFRLENELSPDWLCVTVDYHS